MSAILDETMLTLPQLARRENVAVCTVWRWALRGVRGVKLETINRGGRRLTSDQAFRRWVTATTAAAQGAVLSPQTPRQRAAAIAAAERELDKAGVR